MSVYNGAYHESDYEKAFIEMLCNVGYSHIAGDNLLRESARDVLYIDDMARFIEKANRGLSAQDVKAVIDRVKMAGGDDDFSTLHSVYNLMVNDIDGVKCEDGKTRRVKLIDYDNVSNNIFRVVNQLAIEYTNSGVTKTRRPDVLLYINGMPVCIIELKNPADENATIEDAWRQICKRYWRDIPHLLHYCPLACISDGVNTRLGTVYTPYEHFYSWRRVNNEDKVGTKHFNETETLIKGVYEPKRFLEIFRDYIYFQDSDKEKYEIVCRYPQFFATRLLKESIIKSITEREKRRAEDKGKGGTYFGATGCGKTYTMMFLARQLSIRCKDVAGLGSPTVVMIVDRDDLQKQGARLFTKSEKFLCAGDVNIIESRAHLRKELGLRQSGGFYICTIQKFCDRQDDKIGLINDRLNIICFSDEAHRTQLSHSRRLKVDKEEEEEEKDNIVSENTKEKKPLSAIVSKAYIEVLK